jgi:hypothetical protein
MQSNSRSRRGRGDRPEGHRAGSVPCPNLDLDPLWVQTLYSFVLLKGKGIAILPGTCEKDELIKLLIAHTPAVPHTVICSVQGSVGNPVSGSAELRTLESFRHSIDFFFFSWF